MINSKKGLTTSTIIKLILGMIVLVVAIIILLNVTSQTKPATTLDCGNSIVGKGTCRDVCSASESVKVKGYGCPPADNADAVYCCIDPNYKSSDVGGDSDYRFEVFDIGLDPSQLNGKCKETKTWTYTCTSGTNLKVKMSVTNTGNFPLDIFANPKVGETYPKQGTPVNVKAGDTKVLAVDLALESKKSYIIKAAAKCTSTTCKQKFGDQGIFKLNDDQYITVIVN